MMHYVLNLYQIMTVRRFAPCVSDIKSARQYWPHCSIPAPLPYANGKLGISTQAVLHRNFSICLNIKGLRYYSKSVLGSDTILDVYFLLLSSLLPFIPMVKAPKTWESKHLGVIRLFLNWSACWSFFGKAKMGSVLMVIRKILGQNTL